MWSLLTRLCYNLFVQIALCFALAIFFWPHNSVLSGLFAGSVVVILLEQSIRYWPIKCQRPYYRYVWKPKAQAIRVSPLIDYPYAIWVEFSMDAEFEKGGIRQAERAAKQWVENYSKSMQDRIASQTEGF